MTTPFSAQPDAIKQDVLGYIVNRRKERLTLVQQDFPEDAVFEQAKQRTLTYQPRSLIAALQAQHPGFILECKKASPSKGLIREHFNPVEIARTYQNYAAGISVLTEPDFFQGSFAYMQAVRSAVTVPVLCKDFVVNRYQVALARYFGADAILLMLSVLDDATYQDLYQYANELKLEVLTEVYNEEEMHRAVAMKAPLIGVNHRNLKDLSIDLTRSKRLAALAPEGTVMLAESGIYSHAEVQAIAPFVQGFLVGSSLTAQPDIDQACRQLVYGTHKVCGLTQAQDALAAYAAGAYYGGFIFAKRSPRRIELVQAQEVQNIVPGLHYVGIFAFEDAQELASLSGCDPVQAFVQHIQEHAQQLSLHAIQLHDIAHNHELCHQVVQQLRQVLPADTRIWLAVSLTKEQPQLPDCDADLYVCDQGKGGTGQAFDWSLLENQAVAKEKLLIAGGIGLDNIEAALALGCHGLDMNSALEVRPGFKNASLVTQAFDRIRQTCFPELLAHLLEKK